MFKLPFHTLALLVSLGLSGIGCADSSSMPTTDTGTLPMGAWGGQHVSFNVAPGTATVEFDCAHGQIEGAIAVDSGGRFDVSGTFVFEGGGPRRPGVTPDSRPARYRGTVTRGTMTLTVTVEGGLALGPFTLSFGETARLLKCL